MGREQIGGLPSVRRREREDLSKLSYYRESRPHCHAQRPPLLSRFLVKNKKPPISRGLFWLGKEGKNGRKAFTL
jgi:hypothetical protein